MIRLEKIESHAGIAEQLDKESVELVQIPAHRLSGYPG
jgi:hypothetical protein